MRKREDRRCGSEGEVPWSLFVPSCVPSPWGARAAACPAIFWESTRCQPCGAGWVPFLRCSGWGVLFSLGGADERQRCVPPPPLTLCLVQRGQTHLRCQFCAP